MLGAAGTGCQAIAGYEEFEGATEQPDPCSVLPLVKNDALGVMARVRVSPRCIWMDTTEVTVEQYELWQTAVPEVTDWEREVCSWKRERTAPGSTPDDACVTLLSSHDLQPFAPRKPIRCVDFCDAEAFCRWAGKRLCDDAASLGAQATRTDREWFLGCTNSQATIFPWGNDADAGICNVLEPGVGCVADGTCGPITIKSDDRCSTPSGIEHLLGNVAEWVSSCNLIRGSEPVGCLTRGGAYDEPLRDCGFENTLSNDTRRPGLGFRCCADLTPGEEVEIATGATRE